jgi:integrase/recombinase XerD
MFELFGSLCARYLALLAARIRPSIVLTRRWGRFRKARCEPNNSNNVSHLSRTTTRIRVNLGKGGKDRLVPFPATFALHMDAMRHRGAIHLFESSWKKPYSTPGVRAMLTRYTNAAGLAHPISPHQLRHFLFTWLKTQGIDDALIQPYSGHESRQSLEIYSRLALADAQQRYNEVITRFPV